MAKTPNTTQTWEETKELLESLSLDVKRVYVLRDTGKKKWLDPDDVEDTDRIIFKPDGKSPSVMTSTPGRPAGPQPVSAVAAQTSSVKQHTMGRDPLMGAVKSDPESPVVLDQVIAGLAEESSSLRFERLQAEARGEDTSAYSVRRGRLLVAVGETWLKRKDVISSRIVDLDSPAFKVLFSYIIESFKDAMADAGVRPEMVDRVVGKFGDKLGPEWEKEAKDRMDPNGGP